MKYGAGKDVAVVIPARDEEDRIGDCLTALANQNPERVVVILVVNNTTDDTKLKAQKVAGQLGLKLEVMDCVLPGNRGVGTARNIGCELAVCLMPDLRYLLMTDADCLVAADWVACNIEHLKMVDVVCGRIDLIADEKGILDGMDRKRAADEGTYRKLVQQTYASYGDRCADLQNSHGEAAGASLGFTKQAYLHIGGFDPEVSGEDRAIVRAARLADFQVRHADDVSARASCRLNGRAIGGMSDALKARINGSYYLIDDSLPEAEWLVSNVASGTLGVWPPLVPDASRIHVRNLPHHIEILDRFLRTTKGKHATPALSV